MPPTIYEYIKQEENRFETEEIKVADNWNWSFRNHVQLIFHLKNGVFFQGENGNWLRAFKNIMEPLLNLSYWAEDIEVKDIVFTAGEDDRVLSFLIKKYHEEVYVKENNLDTMFDEIIESDLDYGGVLVQKTKDPKPEVFALNSVAFCDQTDILGGAIGFKYNFSPSKLRGMAKFGWGDTKNGATITLDELCTLAEPQKDAMKGQKNQTTSKNIEAYMVRGNLPEAYLEDNDDMEYECNQIQIVAFYYDKANKKQGVTLYRKKEDEGNLKFHTSKKVYGRALGRGEGEGLLHPQIWTNFLTIHKMNFLAAASKVPLYTDDEDFKNKNQIQDMENLEITTVADGKKISQIPTASPINVQLVDKAIDEWYQQGQLVGSAYDPILGKEAVSGTTFRGQAQVVNQGKGLHERRRGQRAKFIEEIYRDFIIPQMVKEILNGKKFLATLSMDEMQWMSDQIAENLATKYAFEKIYSGQPVTEQDKEAFKQKIMQQMAQKGNKHLLEILKGEFEGIEVRIGINVAGKQKDLAAMSDKMLSVFQTIIANPYILKSPPVLKLFNEIIELSGLQPIDISGLNVPALPTRRMTETINYADLATPPNDAQKKMLEMAGIEQPQPTPTQ